MIIYRNEEGVELKAGMKVKGDVIIHRSFGRTTDKTITGTILKLGGNLYVNSDSNPNKNYPLSKFAYMMCEPEVAYLQIINHK